jgi:acylphosphatase
MRCRRVKQPANRAITESVILPLDERSLRCVVSGRVQGVWYRASTAKRATELKLRGSAKNLADGRVEVLLSGQSEPLAEMCAWLWRGSAAARVTGVEVEEWLDPVGVGFETL